MSLINPRARLLYKILRGMAKNYTVTFEQCLRLSAQTGNTYKDAVDELEQSGWIKPDGSGGWDLTREREWDNLSSPSPWK